VEKTVVREATQVSQPASQLADTATPIRGEKVRRDTDGLEASSDRTGPPAAAPLLSPEQQRDREAVLDRLNKIPGASVGEDDTDAEIQRELGRLEEAFEDVEELVLLRQQDGMVKAYRQIILAIDLLLAPKPKLDLAKCIRYRLQLDVLRHQPRTLSLTKAIIWASAGAPTVIIVLGLVLSAFLGLLVAAVWPGLSQLLGLDRVGWLNSDALLTVVVAAYLGGIVSIAQRLKDFSRVRDVHPLYMFWTSALKPAIGVALAIFVYAVFTTGLVGIDLPANAAPEGTGVGVAGGGSSDVSPLWWVIGFLAGFSERLAWDFVAQNETRFGAAAREGGRANQ
jgi:hypothetical protein